MRSGMFTSVNGDRKYSSSFFAEYFSSFIGNGVFPNPSTGMQVMAATGLDVSVRAGKAWIDGYVLFNDEDTSFTIAAGDERLDRIDKLVIRMNKLEREITVAIKEGIPATNPAAPSLQRDEDMHELGIANIRVAKGSTVISQRHITDLRHDSEQCGIVTGTVEEIDTTTLFNQYQNWLENKKDEFDQDLINYTDMKQTDFENWVDDKELDYNTFTNDKKGEWDNWYDTTTVQLQQDFMAWVSMLEDVLDENTAGNLLNMIDQIPRVLSSSQEPVDIRAGDYWLRELS